jgi:RHS repeat-associated protein
MGSVQRFETINEATEAYSVTLLDGAGRVRATAADLPNSTGLYSGRYIEYDAMGRVNKTSNPTEINGAWTPAGDDATVGWKWTQQSYDWKGRPLVTTKQDGWTTENCYGGCGCAGGAVITSRDEAGRKRKATMDNFGRLVKLEELNWNEAVYATTIYSYNERDQLTNVTQQSDRVRTFNYDGYGRLESQITPEQGQTNYTYYEDDFPKTVIDARGAKATFTPNSRHLLTNIAYDVSQAPNVTATSAVAYSYDAAGNRTSMSDGLGSTSYSYNQLSRLTSETRSINGVNSFTLNYGYNLAGELTNLTTPWAQITYGYDFTGRLINVGGSGFAGLTSYVDSLTYRAFGGVKGVTYHNNRSLSVSYDSRLRPTEWNVGGLQDYKYFYDYFNEHTGRVTYAQNVGNDTLDRSYEYDHAGRLSYAHSGAEARAHAYSGQWGTTDGPYSLGFAFDEWGNMTRRFGWGGEVQGGSPSQSTDFPYTYNSHNQRTVFSYDPAGNLSNDLGQQFSYDATGQQTLAWWGSYQLQQNYDGDGLRVKKVDGGATTLYLRSTVLGGQVVAELSSSGTFTRGYVYLGGQLLAVQQSSSVNWVHEDPITKSKRVTNSSGSLVSAIELDPWGADAGVGWVPGFQPKKFTSYERDANGSDEAMLRRFNRWHSRFDQPDPYEGSHDFTDPQSLNRYSYTQNDPVNFVDPTGLMPCIPGDYSPQCDSSGFGGWGGGFNMNDHHSSIPGGSSGRETIAAAEQTYNRNAFRFLPIDEATILPTDFGFNSLWFGFMPQDPLPTPKPSPHPSPMLMSKSDQENEEAWKRCVKIAVGDQLGIKELMVGVGLIPVPKRAAGLMVTQGASEYTNLTSYAGHKLFPGANLPYKVLGTNRIFGIAGRAMPWVAAALASYDIYKIAEKVSVCNSAYNVYKALEFVHP